MSSSLTNNLNELLKRFWKIAVFLIFFFSPHDDDFRSNILRRNEHFVMNPVFKLSSIAQLFRLEICDCAQCKKIEEEMVQFLAPGPAWHTLLSSIQGLSDKCDVLSTLSALTKGSLCSLDMCAECFQTGSFETNPRIEDIVGIVDVNDFEVTDMSNSEGSCPHHGSFMVPFCLGDPPRVMLLSSEGKVPNGHVVFKPLQLMWNGNRFTPVNRTKHVYVPNPLLWPSNILYNIRATIILTSPKPSEPVLSHSPEGCAYLLERVTSPLNTQSCPLTVVLSDHTREHEKWLLFQCIIGASNGRCSVLGKPIFRKNHVSETEKLQSRSTQSPSPNLSIGTDLFLSPSELKSPDFSQLRQRISLGSSSHKANGPQTQNYISPSPPSESQYSPSRDSSSSSELCRSVDIEENLETVMGSLQNLSFHSPAMSSRDASHLETAGDPTYSPEVDLDGSTVYDEDDCCGHTEREYGLPPKRKLRFIFEGEIETAEKKDKKKDSSRAGEDTRKGALPDSALLPTANCKSVKYRVPILHASAHHFKSSPEPVSERSDTISAEEALQRLQSDTLPLVRGTLIQGPHIDFTKSSPMDTAVGPSSLQFHVDVDSIDFVTISLGGNAFHVSNASIPLTWQRSFSKEREIAERNNGLTAFLSAYSREYPGNYFGTNVNTSVKTRRFRGYKEDLVLNSPMQIQILDITLGWAYPLKVCAILPSKCSLLLIKGSGALLELFLSKKSGGRFPREEKNLNARHTLCEMVWYILTSAILFFCDVATKDGSSPGVWFRPSCCAFPPTALNEDTLHDKKYGHLSDYNISQKLTPGSLTVALCLLARHQRAVEQHSRLPRNFQSTDLRNVAKYRIDTELYSIVNPALLPILQEDIGSPACLTWFRTFWNDNHNVLGDIVSLRSDFKRRDENALPSRQSNIEALRKGEMCLEDLLCFNHVIFRGTLHGAKESAYNKAGLNAIKQVLMKNLCPNCFQDGTADVGYVFHASSEAGNDDFSLHLNRKIVAGGVLLPESANKSLREYGSYMTGTSGFPSFVGFSTRKGTCADPSTSITPYGIRKVKAYSTKWRADSFRGQTVYSTPRAKKVLKQFSNAKALYALCLATQQDRVIQEVHRLETGITYMLHNNAYRAGSVSSFQNRIGVRLEYTCFFDSSFQFLDEPLALLSLRDNVHEVQLSGNTAEDEDMERFSFPWWKDYNMTYNNSEFPFIAVSRRTMHLFSLLLEKRLLCLSLEIYKTGIRLLTNATETIVSPNTAFLEPILAKLGTMAAAKFISVLSSAVYRAAFHEVDGTICRIPQAIPISPDGYLSSSGAVVSSWFSGYPAVLLSRICRFPVFGTGYKLTVNGNTSEIVSLQQARLLSTNDDFFLPNSLRYTQILAHSQVRYLQLTTSHFDSGPDSVVHFVSKIMDVWHSTQTQSGSDIRFLGFSLATLTVRFLIQDVFRTMRAMKASNFKKNSNDAAHDVLMDESLTSLPVTNQLTKASFDRRMWPQAYRLCHSSSTSSIEDSTERLCRDFDLQRHAVIVHSGSGWARKTVRVDEEGFISDEDFINVLWSTAESTANNPSSPEKHVFPDGYNPNTWLSVYALQVAMQIFNIRKDESLFKAFSQSFREGMSAALWCAAFGLVTPAFQRKTSGILRKTLGLWGPDMLFCRMKFVSDASRQSHPSPESCEQEVENIQDELKGIWKALDDIQKSRLSYEVRSSQWNELSKRYNDISASFWNLPDIDDLIISYIQTFFEKEKRIGTLQDLDLNWIMNLVFSLVQLRRDAVDEGLAARRTIGRDLCLARDSEVLSTVAQMLRYPWVSIYPSPESVYKKKSRVKHVSKVLSQAFPMLFKVRSKAELAREANEGLLRNCEQLTVEELYEKLSLQDKTKAGNSVGHWRLAPTRVVALSLLNEVSFP